MTSGASHASRETDPSWDRILAEVMDQREATVQADTRLEFGQPIAWNRVRGRGETCALTEVHRVGATVVPGAPPFTACGFSLPAPSRWLPLSPALIRTLPKCKYCEAEVARVAKERAA